MSVLFGQAWKVRRMSGIELKKMSEIEYHLPETFLKIVKRDQEYGIFLL